MVRFLKNFFGGHGAPNHICGSAPEGDSVAVQPNVGIYENVGI